MVHRLNEQQARAVETLSSDVVVRAGAGTGKTMTLARRFVDALDPRPGWGGTQPERILTITFTNKAANELSERIRGLLLARGDLEGARSLGHAWISTIDAFCARVLRRYALDAGVDPGFRIMAEVEKEALRDRVYREMMDANPRAVVLARLYGQDTLKSCVVRAYDRLGSMGRSAQEIRHARPADAGILVHELDRLLEAYEKEVHALGPDLNATQCRNLETASRLRTSIGDPLRTDPEGLGAILAELAGVSFSAAARPKETASTVKAKLEEVADGLATHLTRGAAVDFETVLEAFSREYGEAKRSRGALDYADVIHYVSGLFAAREDIADEVSQRFDLIMVDEFQDTNQAQMNVIGPITASNLCVVGDDKQSIYGFRYADIGVFDSLARDIGEVLPLDTNYRSHPDVLGAVNGIFSEQAFFGPSLQRLAPGRGEDRAPSWPAEMPRVRVCISDSSQRDSMSAREAQAAVVARRVGEFVDAGIEPGDIVILLRAMSGAALYARAVRERGIETLLASGEAFHESVEVEEIKALLGAVLLPSDDHALARLLSGRLVDMSPEAIFGLRTLAGKGSLDDALGLVCGGSGPAGFSDPSDRERATRTVSTLAALREAHSIVGPSELIEMACDRFGYKNRLLEDGVSGIQGWANVRKLVRMATHLENEGPADAGTLLRYLSDHESAVPNEPVAVASCPGRAVRIMSVHAAKGLEFPVVIVADLARPLLSTDAPRILLERVDDQLRLALKCPPDGSSSEAARDIWYEEVRRASREADLAEEVRIFYVACTRAEEALVLVGDTCVESPRGGCMAGMVLEALGKPDRSGDRDVGSGRVHLDIEAPETWGDQREPLQGGDRQAEEATEVVESEDAEKRLHPTALGETQLPPPRRLSYSSIHRFETCPLRFWLSMNGLRQDGLEPRIGAIEFGSALHEVLEATHDPALLDTVVGTVAGFHDLDEDSGARLLHAARGLWRTQASSFIEKASFLDREVPFALEISGVLLEGSIDLLARQDGTSLIVDYKSGSDGSASMSDARQAAYDLQARCYALAELELGSKVVSVTFAFLEQNVREHTLVFSASDRGRIRAELERRIEAVIESVSRDVPPAPTPSQEACVSCPAANSVCTVGISSSAV